MSRDAKNSIVLWSGTMAIFAVFWLISQFDLMGWFPEEWVWPVVAVLIALNLIEMLSAYVRRRKRKTGASNG